MSIYNELFPNVANARWPKTFGYSLCAIAFITGVCSADSGSLCGKSDALHCKVEEGHLYGRVAEGFYPPIRVVWYDFGDGWVLKNGSAHCPHNTDKQSRCIKDSP